MPARGQRRQQILAALATMLQTHPGSRITTAALARQVGVSEAALYRHFPSKAKMLEALIEFTEETLFTRIKTILSEDTDLQTRLKQILWLVLSFAETNPGFARLLIGDALQGESERLRQRMRQLFDRIETTLKQCLREHYAQTIEQPSASPAAIANLLLACVEGRINQFVRSEFRDSPTDHWAHQWQVLSLALPQSSPSAQLRPPGAG